MANFWVSKSGNNGNAGTSSGAAKLTIAAGLALMSGGDTLFVGAGTYAESILNAIPRGSSTSVLTTVRADDPANRPVLQPTASPASVITFDGAYSYIKVSGFICDAVNCSDDCVRISYTISGSTQVAHDIWLDALDIKNTTGASKQGLNVFRDDVSGSTQGGYCKFTNLDISSNGHTGENLSQGMYLETSHNLISSCSFHHNKVNGLSLFNGFPNQSIDSNTITCCRFYSNGLNSPASSGFGAGLVIGCGRGTIAFNNLIYGNNNTGGAGVFIDSFSGSTNTKSVTFVNNTIYDNAGYGLYIENISSGIIVRNNILYSNGTDFSDNAADTVKDHNLTTNPAFTNGSTTVYDLTLSASTSAAVDAGTTVSTVTADFIGTARPQGSAYDIGAYEFIQSTGGGGGGLGFSLFLLLGKHS